MENKKNNNVLISILYIFLFLISSVPFIVMYYRLSGTTKFNPLMAEIIHPVCSSLTIALFYPIYNFFDKVIHVSTVGVTYVIAGTVFYALFGYFINWLLLKLRVRNIILRVILSVILLPISGIIYAPFAPPLF